LTSRNEGKKKEKKGIEGSVRGRQAAALYAAGAGWGSAAMLSFASQITARGSVLARHRSYGLQLPPHCGAFGAR
jgi:hypothetical protein